MKKRIIYDNEKVVKEDLNYLQDYIYESIFFILEEILTYPNFFTGDNLKVKATDPTSMSVVVPLGDGHFNYRVGYLTQDITINIDPPGTEDRTDLITAVAVETEDDLSSRWFIDPVTEEEGSQNVNNRKIYKYNINYYPNTTEVPTGEVGLATVFVEAEATQIYDTDITDIRSSKPSQDLSAHRNSNPIDHADGSIGNAAISPTAGIQLGKLDGHSVDNLLRWLYLKLELPMAITFTYEGDVITGYSAVGDYSHNATFTYDANGYITKVELNDGVYKDTTTFTYANNMITGYTEEVVAL